MTTFSLEFRSLESKADLRKRGLLAGGPGSITAYCWLREFETPDFRFAQEAEGKSHHLCHLEDPVSEHPFAPGYSPLGDSSSLPSVTAATQR